ncbi:MAG TPA: EscU/YscU/HrcU family type III secretion system export apparatus switch protein [Vicinamibacterales bacterium]|jgi:flagellar biosynthesis protein
MTDDRKRRNRAAALRYERGEDLAPRVVAKGQGLIADTILAIAAEHGIPVHKDPALVDVLSRLDVDQYIPPELYLVVAEVLAFIYRAQAAAGGAPAPASNSPSAAR